jgi:SAM-dependent methyltransferase
MDACAMDLHPEDADLIVAFDVFEELADPQRFLTDAHRVLAPKGALLLSIANPHVSGMNGGGDPGLASDRIGVVDDLRRSLEARFGRVVCFGQSLETDRLTIRPEMLDARRDVGFLMMALQPQRAPVEPETSKPERVVRRRAA